MMPPSKPSGPPNRPSDRGRSITSWTIPQPADVICYSYLWARESEAGQEEGLKDRPVVVVLATIVTGGRTELLVAPVTHSQPQTGEGVEIPARVKQHLGLDNDRSWIIATELNRFTWPGPDIRMVTGTASPLYGAIPARLFAQLKESISSEAAAGRLRIPNRTE